MNILHNGNGYDLALQLIKIAQMECESKICAVSALVIGKDETANAIAEILGCKIAKEQYDIAKVTAETKFAAVFLFSGIEEEVLNSITETDSAVIDMTSYQSDESVWYSCASKYKRIRVISLFQNEKM